MQPSTAKLGQVSLVLPYVSKTAGCMINMCHLRFWWTFWEQYDGLCFCEFRLQEKLTNLENENHVLRQKAFNMPTMNNLPVAPKTLSEVPFFVTLSKYNPLFFCWLQCWLQYYCNTLYLMLNLVTISYLFNSLTWFLNAEIFCINWTSHQWAKAYICKLILFFQHG